MKFRVMNLYSYILYFNIWLLYKDSMENTHITKETYLYWNKAVLFYLLVQSYMWMPSKIRNQVSFGY